MWCGVEFRGPRNIHSSLFLDITDGDISRSFVQSDRCLLSTVRRDLRSLVRSFVSVLLCHDRAHIHLSYLSPRFEKNSSLFSWGAVLRMSLSGVELSIHRQASFFSFFSLRC